MIDNKKIKIYIDMDNVLCDYQKAYDFAVKKNPDIKYPQSQYGFFRNLEPIIGSLYGFKLLSKYFDVWILTSPSIQNPMSYSEKREWVEKHLGYESAEKLIISPDKSIFIGDYLIDDIVAGKAKQDKFDGIQIVFGGNEYPNWIRVIEYFSKYIN